MRSQTVTGLGSQSIVDPIVDIREESFGHNSRTHREKFEKEMENSKMDLGSPPHSPNRSTTVDDLADIPENY